MQFSDLKRYNYSLPPERIRKKGVEPRDSARLFVYDTGSDTLTFDTFRNLSKYLPEKSVVVLNNTKVLPARLWLQKETGGKIEVFVLANQIESEERIPVLVDRKTEIGKQLFFPNGDSLVVVDQNENIFYVQLKSNFSLTDLLSQFGQTPLPHYLEGEEVEESRLRERYQTIFAEAGASVAAPTASLHFTDAVFDSFAEKSISVAPLTLNVGLGTFAPLKEENFASHRLHTEFFEIPEETAEKVNGKKLEKCSVVAVGTTVTRTLESVANEGRVAAGRGKTDIFIFPPYHFQVVDILMTNFHLPQTSLMLLVDAFLENKKSKKNVGELYRIAIENKFDFYSFGDSMLIL